MPRPTVTKAATVARMRMKAMAPMEISMSVSIAKLAMSFLACQAAEGLGQLMSTRQAPMHLAPRVPKARPSASRGLLRSRDEGSGDAVDGVHMQVVTVTKGRHHVAALSLTMLFRVKGVALAGDAFKA